MIKTVFFPNFVSDLKYEALKIFLFRVTVCVILLYRAAFNLLAVAAHPEASTKGVIIVIGLLFCVLVGLGTRYGYLVLAVIYFDYNTAYGFMNLGTLFPITFFIALLFLDRRPSYSLDAWLAKRHPWIDRYLFWGSTAPTKDDFNFWYTYLFMIYAINSLAAVIFHLYDEYWRRGQTVLAMLTNSYLSGYYEFFRYLELHYKDLFLGFSILAVVLQTVFQLFMWPLIFNKWGRVFVAVHGLFFFLFSWIFLKISILPAIEVALWALLFGSWVISFTKFELYQRIELTIFKKIFFVLFLIISSLVIADSYMKASGGGFLSYRFSSTFVRLGIWPPNVFNVHDLKMGEKWFVGTLGISHVLVLSA